MKAEQKALDKAKIELMSRPDSAFFTTVFFSVKHIWNDSIPTAQTDGTSVEFNPDFFMSLDMEEQVFLILHETMHIAYQHMLRIGNRDPERWNHACDYEENAQLIKAGFKMPEGGLYHPDYAGLGAEKIYELLEDQPDPPKSSFGMDLVDPGTGAGSDAPEKLEEVKAQIDDILVRAKLQSEMNGDDPGSIPGNLRRYIENLTNPKLPWDKILAKYMNSLAKEDYSYKRPNRRYLPDFYLPTLHSEALEHIAIAVDASGSVTDREFEHCFSEIHHAVKKYRPKKLTLIHFDTRIQKIDTIEDHRDLMKVEFHGRGGTNVNEVIEWARTNKPKVLLIFSDGHFRNRSTDPKVPIVWLIYDNHTFQPNFGKVIHYEMDR